MNIQLIARDHLGIAGIWQIKLPEENTYAHRRCRSLVRRFCRTFDNCFIEVSHVRPHDTEIFG